MMKCEYARVDDQGCWYCEWKQELCTMMQPNVDICRYMVLSSTDPIDEDGKENTEDV